jgi:hypothetical protein
MEAKLTKRHRTGLDWLEGAKGGRPGAGVDRSRISGGARSEIEDTLGERATAEDMTPMDEKRQLLRHFLAALAYRTQKALRGAPPAFDGFRAGGGVRTPAELVCHMTSVLGYARTYLVGGQYRPEPLPSLQAETERFHEMLVDLGRHLESGAPLREGMTPERLLQGPLADAMTHAGQLAVLRRLAGEPVPPENFIVAAIDGERCGPDQPEPVSPDEHWPEAPPGWTPPLRR